jgi:hypothetical protein
LVLRRLGGNRAVADLARRHRAGASRAVVQRAVGFEFETGWLVRRTAAQQTWLKKKDQIGPTWGGFKLEADEAEEGKSEIEFIVHPPVPETGPGYASLDATMTNMERLGRDLEHEAARSAYFRLSDATGRHADGLYVVYPRPADKLEAGPQVTTGLDLAAIGRLAKASEPPDPLMLTFGSKHAPIPPELADTALRLERSAVSIRGVEAIKNPSPALRGLVTLVTTYLDAGTLKLKEEDRSPYNLWGMALSYPKQIGDHLLARTDFGTLFGLLHRQERELLRAQPVVWIELVLSNLKPEWPLTVLDSVIGRGVRVSDDDPHMRVVVPPLKIGEWLPGILEGRDLIPTSIAGAESMGEFGSRTEPVGGGDTGLFARDVGIFEFRGAQTNKIPLSRWGPFAREFHNYVRELHDR